MTTKKTSRTGLSPAAKLNATGLVVAAAGLMIQYFSGVDFRRFRRGPSDVGAFTGADPDRRTPDRGAGRLRRRQAEVTSHG